MKYWVALLVLSTACAANPNAASKTGCGAASPEVRRAIEQQIEGYVPGACPNCVDVSLRSSNRVLEQNREAAVSCLNEVFERGYEQAGVWTQPVPAPAERDWTLTVMGHLNPAHARVLFEKVARSEPDEMRSMWAKANAVRLGSRAFLGDLESFLATQPNPIGAGASWARTVGGAALEALSAADYVDALDTIRSLRERDYPDPRLGVYEAQFSRDRNQLRELVRPGPTGLPALQALATIGEKNVVGEIARTPSHPLSTAAQGVLDSADKK